jgi:hypothetical protein
VFWISTITKATGERRNPLPSPHGNRGGHPVAVTTQTAANLSHIIGKKVMRVTRRENVNTCNIFSNLTYRIKLDIFNQKLPQLGESL